MYISKKFITSVGMVALVGLLCALDGKGGAKIILSLAKDYFRKRNNKIAGMNKWNEAALRNACLRLRRDGLIKNEGRGIWKIMEKGKKTVQWLLDKQSLKRGGLPSKRKEDTIIIFDIPEQQRKKRDYLRFELVALGFRQLQKSVWIGDGPLPNSFIEYLAVTNMLDFVHIFSIKGKGTVA